MGHKKSCNTLPNHEVPGDDEGDAQRKETEDDATDAPRDQDGAPVKDPLMRALGIDPVGLAQFRERL